MSDHGGRFRSVTEVGDDIEVREASHGFEIAVSAAVGESVVRIHEDDAEAVAEALRGADE